MLRVIDPRQDTLGVPEFRDRLEVRLIDAHGRSVALPSKGRADGFTVATRWQPIPAPDGFTRAFELQISLVSHDAKADGLGIQVALALDGDARRFLVPGLFYGENRPLACDVRYPRFDTEQADGDSLAANHWSFRADRASHPVVLGWTDTECVALAVEERSALGLNGIGFTAQGQPAVL
jgi:hypothetical protein